MSVVSWVADNIKTFDAACADPDDVVLGSVVRRRHVVDHWVDNSLFAADVQPTLNRRVALLQTLDHGDGWVLVILHTEQQLKL